MDTDILGTARLMSLTRAIVRPRYTRSGFPRGWFAFSFSSLVVF